MLPEEPESSEVEEEELPAGPLHTEVSDALPEPSMRLALPVPSPAEGLAEAALEDGEWCSGGLGGPPVLSASPNRPLPPVPVENLRLLILRRLLPSRDTEPEDDLTPTPSVIGGTHTWDSVLSSQDSASQEVLAEPPSAAEEPKSRSGWEEQSETGPTVSAEEQSSYKVVRKGRGSCQPPPGHEGGTWGLLLSLPSLGFGVSLHELWWIRAGMLVVGSDGCWWWDAN